MEIRPESEACGRAFPCLFSLTHGKPHASTTTAPLNRAGPPVKTTGYLTMNDEVEQLLDELNGVPFRTAVGVSSGLRSTIRIIESYPTVERLIGLSREDDKVVQRVFLRTIDLAMDSVDARYQSEHDPALTALLIVLSHVDDDLWRQASEFARVAPNTWWVRWYLKSKKTA